MASAYDVFLSYNSHDRRAVENIGAWLKTKRLSVWFDQWELRPGLRWQEGLEEGVRASKAVAVFVGEEGLGSWQESEVRAFLELERSRRERVPVIPVLLPGCPKSPELGLFLRAYTWVDLREGVSEEGLERLLWGITGVKPPELGGALAFWGFSGVPRDWSARRSSWLRYGGLGLAVGLAVAGGLWLRREPSPPLPAIYALRVQVFDPEGHPVSGAKVRASAGNEPHLLPDGWWEIQIPQAKVPKDGRLSVRADHEAWEGSEVEVRLTGDPNPSVAIRLKPPKTWVRGRVVDDGGHAVAGVRITRQDGGEGQAVSGDDGRFELPLTVPRNVRVGLHVEGKGAVKDVFCYAGSEICPILLER
jgi:TIR domain